MIDENGIERENCRVHLRDDIEYTSEDGVFIKAMVLDKAGILVAQHSHEYSHTSLVGQGSVRVWKDEELLGDFKAPANVFIEARCKHKFLSLEDNTKVYCIHNVGIGAVSIHEKNYLKEIV